MSKPVTLLSGPKMKVWRNLFLAIILLFVAFGQSRVVVAGWVIRPIVYVEILTLTLAYIVATLWNIYRLIPHLLLRNRYGAYIGALFGVAVLFVVISVLFEWATLHIYHLTPGDYGYFASDNFLFFDIACNLVCYFISLIATSVIVFLQHWWQSGERIQVLEETGVRVELETERHKIDSAALFDVLDKAASILGSVPHEATRMLMELSKSLRRQLYESHQKHFFATPVDKTNQTFRKESRLLNFLIDKRYRLARNLLMVFAVCIIGSANVDPRNAFPFVELGVLAGVFMALIYINVYVLLPQLFFKNRWMMYLVALVLITIGFIFLLVPSDYVEEKTGIFWIFILASIAQIGFLFAGTTSIVLFQHWARNERYIAQLEAATMRAELEQLQNQINPHFLFNMLNNILVLIRENPEEAVVILHKLSDMLKYQFHDSTKKEVLLNDDIRFLTDFLNLEKIRRDRFEFTITVENEPDGLLVPPLLFIPFVENAVKHSNDAANMSYIHLCFKTADRMLHFTCHNSKPLQPRRKSEYSGLGLANIKRRLELLYGENHTLKIQEDDTSYTIQLSIQYV